ncbi:MAG TPA: type VI secretion system membrane subunit TssM [Polyangia bacterium]
MLKYVFAAIFVALAWAAAAVFDLPSVWPIVATVVVVGGLVAFALVRWLLARRAAGRIENALTRGADDDGLRPEVRAQIQAMQAEFNRALQTLKSSKAGRSGKSALSALPWYVIIGPPGSGKSTLLRNSGLRFPYLSAKRGAVRGVGGTRNCDWWMANEGILLDTAGRWSTDEDDQDEWLAFLDQLKRTRRGRPINGIMVAISAADLLEQGADDVTTLAKKLRERVDEVMGRLEVTLPVYLIVTKCDLIGGFVETFGLLKDKDRGQIWGVTLPLDAAAGLRPEMFVEKLDRLVDVLELQSLTRLADEPRIDLRRRLFEFPQQFEELCPGLVDLVNELFAENAYQDGPILRGVYFTSATQEGRPIDNIVRRIAESIGVAPLIQSQPVLKAKSYFLRDVFNAVIFPDQNVAGVGDRAVRRRRLLGIAAAAGLFVVAGAIALMPVAAYSRNLGLVSLARSYGETLVSTRAAGGGEPVPSAPLDDLHDDSRRLLGLFVDGPPVGMRFGFYQGGDLLPAVARVARDHVATPIGFRDAEIMNVYAARPGRNFDDVVDALRLHLLMTSPKAEGEPRPGTRSWDEAIAGARELAVARWRRHVQEKRHKPSPRGEQVIGDAVEMYLREASDNRDLFEPRDGETVTKVRKALCDVVRKDPLEQIIGDPAFEAHGVTLSSLVGGSITLFQDDAQVRGAFTRTGYGLVKKRLEARSEAGARETGDWVLGGCEAFTPEDVQALRREYVDKYETAWRSFLSRVYPKEPRDLKEAEDILRRYGEEKPLAEVWKAVADNIPIDPPAEAAAAAKPKGIKDRLIGAVRTGVKDALADEDPLEGEQLRKVDRAFAPFLAFGASPKEGVVSMLDTYFDQLRAVAMALKVYGDSKDARALDQEVERVNREVDALVTRGGRQVWEPVLRKMLMPPLTGLKPVASTTVSGDLNGRWCDGVVIFFDQTLAGRFPFHPAGLDAPLDAVEKFLHPTSGTLWVYFNDALKNDLEPRTFRPKAGSSRYRPALSEYLRRAQRATDLLFFRGAPQLTTPVQVRIWPGSTAVQQITFRMGTDRIVHRNTGERFQPLAWPARDAELTVHSSKPFPLSATGDWALWRLLTKARTQPAQDGDEYLQASWEGVAPGETIRLDIKPAGLLADLRNLAPPRSVASGPSACAR